MLTIERGMDFAIFSCYNVQMNSCIVKADKKQAFSIFKICCFAAFYHMFY